MSPELPDTLSLLLLGARVFPLFHIALPGNGAALRLAKSALAALFTVLLAGVVPVSAGFDISWLLRELLLGISLGTCARLAIETATMAGQVIDESTESPSDTEPTSMLYVALASVLFFAFDGPLLLFTVLVASYDSFPLSASDWQELTLLEPIARGLATAVGIALVLAAPVLTARVAVELGIASIGSVARVRTRVLTAPASHLVAVAMVLLGLGVFAEQFERHTVAMLTDLRHTLRAPDE